MTGNRLGKAKGRRNGNFKCRGDRIDTVAVISPPERDLVATTEERTGDLLRPLPRTAHLRAGQHGNDKDFHGLRVRSGRKTSDHSHEASQLDNAPIGRIHSLRDQIRPITDGSFRGLIGLWLALI